MARTNTYTRTYTRAQAIGINVDGALRNLGWSESSRAALVKIGLAAENRYVTQFHTYGVSTTSGRWQLHHWIDVDWDEYGRLVVTNSTVSLSERWADGEYQGLMGQAEGFRQLLDDMELRPHFAYTLAPDWQDGDGRLKALSHMGLTGGPFSLKPDGEVDGGGREIIPGLSEVSFGIETALPT